MRRLAACVAAGAAALLGGCAQPLLHADHPLAGRIWDVRAGAFIERETLWQRAAAAPHVLIGETHDNRVHHRQQLELLEALARGGARRALALEQFDSEYQPAIDAAQDRAANAERIADAGRFDREGWNWPHYRPLVEFAVARGWPVLAANLSRAEARKPDGAAAALPPADPALAAALERDMVDGHCGHKPDAKTLAFMIETQRARDARMAEVLHGAREGRTVLVAGNGHVRRDRGVPLYMKHAALAIAQVEVRPGMDRPGDYLDGGFATPGSYDILWFTAREDRTDPCAAFRAK